MILIRAVVVVVATLVGAFGLNLLADATRNESDHRVPGTRSEVVVEVQTRRAPPDVAAEGLWGACHMTVAGVRTVDGPRAVGDASYVITVEPALGENDRRRLGGCLEDGTLDRVWADVVAITCTPTPCES